MIVVKPVALVVVSSLVVLGSAAGMYLAVRENRANTTHPSANAIPPLRAPSPVEATEELIPPVDPPEAQAEPMTVVETVDNESQPVAAGSESGLAPAATKASPPPTVDSAPPTTIPTTVAAAPSEPNPQTSDLPPVEGWTQLPERWPASNPSANNDDSDDNGDNAEPNQIALKTIDQVALGVGLPPEEEPSTLRELVMARDSVIGLQIDTPVTSEDAVVEDDVEARVTRDVMVRDEVAIPAGTRVFGSVVLVERAGQLRGSARLGVRFHTVMLDEIVEVPITTETVYREGKGRGSKSAAKIGGAAVGGAILGAIFGGRQGAAIGGAAGAAGGTAAAMAGDGQPATLPAGSTLTIRLSRSSTVTIRD